MKLVSCNCFSLNVKWVTMKHVPTHPSNIFGGCNEESGRGCIKWPQSKIRGKIRVFKLWQGRMLLILSCKKCYNVISFLFQLRQVNRNHDINKNFSE